MKKFAGNKTQDQIRAACKADGFEIDTAKYDNGSDWVTITGVFDGQPRAFIYSSFNGHFIGEDEKAGMFTERSDELDGTGWYDAILNFLYIPATEAAA